MPERSIGHAWKACVPKGTAGSNPAPSGFWKPIGRAASQLDDRLTSWQLNNQNIFSGEPSLHPFALRQTATRSRETIFIASQALSDAHYAHGLRTNSEVWEESRMPTSGIRALPPRSPVPTLWYSRCQPSSALIRRIIVERHFFRRMAPAATIS